MMKVKAISRGFYTDLETRETKYFEKSMIVDVPDEELLHLNGYAVTNHLYDKCRPAWNIISLPERKQKQRKMQSKSCKTT